MERKLQDFPTELLELVLDGLPSKADRMSLWKVSRKFRKLVEPRIFETLMIRVKELKLPKLGRMRLYNELKESEPLGGLKLVKHLHFRALFHRPELNGGRCPHAMLHNYFWSVRERRLYPNGINVSVPHSQRLLSQLEENGLLSFSWDLGMCIPGHILGREGYLTKKQTAIESLSLVTAERHSWSGPGMVIEPVILTSFPKLRKFSWKLLHTTEEMDALRNFFASNFKILEDLELDFTQWECVTIDGMLVGDGSFDPPPSFTDLILPHHASGKTKIFKSLRRLALSAFAFEDSTRGISRAFNVATLQILKLHNCPGVLTFLSTIVSVSATMSLKSLELIMRDDAVELHDALESPLISFLSSFQGLEELYLMLRAAPDRPDYWSLYYWNAILHHSSSLKRLIYHERTSTRVADAWYGWRTVWKDNGLAKLPARDEDYTDYLDNHVYNTATPLMDLECLGISDPDDFAHVVMTAPSAMRKTFKLLHVRRTFDDTWETRRYHRFEVPQGDEMGFEEEIISFTRHNTDSWSHERYKTVEGDRKRKIFRFAQRIFQSPLFDSLKILAFGDFCHNMRHPESCLLLCRASTPNPEVRFRMMSRQDVEFYKRSGVLNVNFLTACPREALARKADWSLGEFP